MRPLWRVLTHCDWCPYNRRLGLRETPGMCMLGGKTMWGQSKKAANRQERGLSGKRPPDTLILDVQPPELWGNKFLCFKPPGLWFFFFNGSSRNLTYCPCALVTEGLLLRGPGIKSLFPTFLVARCCHGIKFWTMRWNGKYLLQLLGCVFKGWRCIFHHSFLLPTARNGDILARIWTVVLDPQGGEKV